MNIGSPSTNSQVVFPSQVAEERLVSGLSSERATENPGSVLKPVAEVAKSNTSTSTSETFKNQVSTNNSPEPTEQDQPQQSRQQLEKRLEAQQQQVEQQQIQQLAARDREVRNHERAHAAVGGSYAGAPRYQYERGPDGINYAVAGEVSISTGGVSGDPQATIEKAQVIRRAALAPAEPSAQDRKVAAQATQMEAEARVELTNIQREEKLAEQEAKSVEQESAPVEQQNSSAITANQPSAQADNKQNSATSNQQTESAQPLNDLNRLITSSNANGLYSEPGQLLNQIA